MKKLVLAATLTVISTPVFAQSTTATGIGIGSAKSSSASQAVAISGQGGQGGSVNIASQPAVTTSNINTHQSGTVTERNVPATFAPGLAAAGLETCLGSVSGGGSFVGTGFSFGSTIPDPGCAARLDARTLWAFGLRKAALARLCLQGEIYRSMPEVCVRYLPQPAYAAPAAAPGYYAPVVLSTNPTGSIELIDGKTGKNRFCSDYDEPNKRCRMWADGVRVAAAKPHKKLVAAPAAAKPAEAAASVTSP